MFCLIFHSLQVILVSYFSKTCYELISIFFDLTDRKLRLNDSQFAVYPISSLNHDNSHIQMFQFSHYDNQRLYDGTHNQLF